MSPVLPRVLPFALYMAFIAVPELLSYVGITLSSHTIALLYPAKIGAAAAALFVFRNQYTELFAKDLTNKRNTAEAIALGLVVYIVWVNLDGFTLTDAPSSGYDPSSFRPDAFRIAMTSIRVLGAALIVPIFEELFWRSFLTRYLINPNFTSVPQGTFTVLSFSATSILFGLEHSYVVAGIMAGIAYNFLYMRTKSTTQCVLAHAVTNGALAAHVLTFNAWHFW